MSPLPRRGLSPSSIVGFVAVAAFILLNGYLSYYNAKRVFENGQAVTESYERRAAAARVLTVMRDGETGQRGFILTGQDRYLEPFLQAKRDLPANLEALSRVNALGPAEVALADQMRTAVDAKMKEMERSIALRREQGFDAALGVVLNDQGITAMDRIRTAAAAIRTLETLELERRIAENERSYSTVIYARILATLVGLGLLAVLYRQSDRQLAERARHVVIRQEQAERFRVTLSSIGDAVIVTDAEGRVRFMNPVAQALTGWLLFWEGQPIGEVFHIRDERSDDPGRDPVARVLRERTVVGLENHTVLVRRDGTRVPIDDSAAPILSADGELTGVVLVFRDITQRRTAERELRLQKEALEESDRRKDEFLAVLAHELRNPLGAVRSAVEVVRQAPADSDTSRRARQIVERQVRFMARMVDDLIDVARISSGRMALRRGPSDVHEAVAAAQEITGPIFEERRHRLEVRLPPERLYVDGDGPRLAQVLANLLGNAAKYTEPGGSVELEATRVGEAARIVIKDDGVGIAPDLLPHVFDLFRQGQHTTGHSQGGLGIGLTLTRRIVELHGGTVVAESPGPGGGSTFTVTLPLCVEPEKEAGASAGTPAGAHRVLIVEDNADGRESLAEMLRLLGHEVHGVGTSREALEQAGQFRPTVALLDLGLPDGTGHDVARGLRADGSLLGLSLVAITGWAQEEDRQRSVAAGFDHHLVKPVEPEALIALLASLPARPAARRPPTE